jgi:hypothetical protein
VHCEQLLALGELAHKPDSFCGGGARPEEDRACNDRPCNSYDYEPQQQPSTANANARPVIRANLNQDYVQAGREKSVRLKVGGRATLLHGTNVKIRCPVKKFKR